MESNREIIRLLEMLDNPEDYSEQEIQSFITRDDEIRKAYEMMASAKRGYRHRHTRQEVDPESAWRRFEQKKLDSKPVALPENLSPKRRLHSFFLLRSSFPKVAAVFAGILFVVGIAFAGIRIVRFFQQGQSKPNSQDTLTLNTVAPRDAGKALPNLADTIMPEAESQTAQIADSDSIAVLAPLEGDEVGADHVALNGKQVYENVGLEKILSDIGIYYHAEVAFQNDSARRLRFYFVWNQTQSLKNVVENLNQFDAIEIELEPNKIVVK